MIRSLAVCLLPIARRAALALVLALSIGVVWAQEQMTEEAFRAAQAQWTLLLDRSQRELSAMKLDDALVQRLNDMINEAKAKALAMRPLVKPLVDAAQELLDALGPKPGDGQPAEDAETAAKRKELETTLSRYDGWERQIEVAITRGDQLLDRVTARRLEQYARQLIQRQASPLSLSTWSQAASETGDIAANVGTSVGLWWNRVAGPGGPFWPAVGYAAAMGAIGLVLGVGAAFLLRRRFGRPGIAGRQRAPYSREHRLIGGSVEAIAWVLPIIAGGGAAWTSFELADMPNQVFFALIAGLGQGIVVFAVSAAAVLISLAPHAPAWRIPDLSDGAARLLSRRLLILAGLVGADYAVDRATDPLVNIDHFTTIWLLLVSLCVALTLHSEIGRAHV